MVGGNPSDRKWAAVCPPSLSASHSIVDGPWKGLPNLQTPTALVEVGLPIKEETNVSMGIIATSGPWWTCFLPSPENPITSPAAGMLNEKTTVPSKYSMFSALLPHWFVKSFESVSNFWHFPSRDAIVRTRCGGAAASVSSTSTQDANPPSTSSPTTLFEFILRRISHHSSLKHSGLFAPLMALSRARGVERGRLVKGRRGPRP